MVILVTGANGQLGSEIKNISKFYKKFQWIFTDVNEFDLSKIESISKKLDLVNPDIIINCAAYTNVDKAESELDIAELVNFKAVDLISNWTSLNDAKLIHISTDYVFDGSSKVPLDELADTNPLNIYGVTKLKGEKSCLKNDKNSIIIRTSWVYSSYGKNFVKTLLDLMHKKKSLDVVNDQIGSPTYAKDLADAIIQIINHKNWIPGVFHYSNIGEISWFEFANSIKKISGINTYIRGVSSNVYPTKAKRPKYSLLNKKKIKEKYNLTIPKYDESLKKCIKILTNEK